METPFAQASDGISLLPLIQRAEALPAARPNPLALGGAHSYCHRSIPGHSIAAVRAIVGRLQGTLMLEMNRSKPLGFQLGGQVVQADSDTRSS